jgi:hypothetical protein
MRLTVEAFHSVRSQVVLRPQEPGEKVLVLGSGQQLLSPLLPEFFGQLIAVVGYSRFPDDGCCGSGFENDRAVHIMKVSPPRRPVSLWLGRLAVEWSGEPQLLEIVPLISKDDLPCREMSLSEFLWQFRSEWDQTITLHAGTADALTVFQSSVTGLVGLEHRVVDVIFRLGLPQAEVSQYAPYVTALIPHELSLRESGQADLATELSIAQRSLEQAQTAFDLAKQKYDAGDQKLRRLRAEYQGWIADSPGAELPPQAAEAS